MVFILNKEHTNKWDLHTESNKKAQSYGHVRIRHHAQYRVAWGGQACETLGAGPHLLHHGKVHTNRSLHTLHNATVDFQCAWSTHCSSIDLVPTLICSCWHYHPAQQHFWLNLFVVSTNLPIAMATCEYCSMLSTCKCHDSSIILYLH